MLFLYVVVPSIGVHVVDQSTQKLLIGVYIEILSEQLLQLLVSSIVRFNCSCTDSDTTSVCVSGDGGGVCGG